MMETTARETPKMGLSSSQITKTGDHRSITVKVNGKILEVSIDEMERYCDLFEEMFFELGRSEANGDLEGLLDEFDQAEITRLRQLHGTPALF